MSESFIQISHFFSELRKKTKVSVVATIFALIFHSRARSVHGQCNKSSSYSLAAQACDRQTNGRTDRQKSDHNSVAETKIKNKQKVTYQRVDIKAPTRTVLHVDWTWDTWSHPHLSVRPHIFKRVTKTQTTRPRRRRPSRVGTGYLPRWTPC